LRKCLSVFLSEFNLSALKFETDQERKSMTVNL